MTYDAMIAKLEGELIEKIILVAKAKIVCPTSRRCAIAEVEKGIVALRKRVAGLTRIQAKYNLA